MEPLKSIWTVQHIPWRCYVFSFELWCNVFKVKVLQNKHNTPTNIVDHKNWMWKKKTSPNIQMIMYILLFLITTFFFPLFFCECFLWKCMDSFQFFCQSFIHQPKKHMYMINYKLAIYIFWLQNQPNLDILR